MAYLHPQVNGMLNEVFHPADDFPRAKVNAEALEAPGKRLAELSESGICLLGVRAYLLEMLVNRIENRSTLILAGDYYDH